MQTTYDLSEVKFALKKEISEALNEGVLGAEIAISEMKVKMRTYQGERDLENAVVRTLQYQLRNSATDN
jgi:hypothetical protein